MEFEPAKCSCLLLNGRKPIRLKDYFCNVNDYRPNSLTKNIDQVLQFLDTTLCLTNDCLVALVPRKTLEFQRMQANTTQRARTWIKCALATWPSLVACTSLQNVPQQNNIWATVKIHGLRLVQTYRLWLSLFRGDTIAWLGAVSQHDWSLPFWSSLRLLWPYLILMCMYIYIYIYMIIYIYCMMVNITHVRKWKNMFKWHGCIWI